MYKDKEKQREAVKRAVEKHRKGITEGITNEGITEKGVTGPVILSDGQLWYPNNYGYHPKECLCRVHPDRTWMTDTAYEEMLTEGIV